MPPAALLLGVAFYDELATGIAPGGSPSIGLGAAAIGAGLFALPSLTGLIEGPLLLRAERAPGRWLRGAFVAMALSCFLGAALSGWPLALALAVYAPASGVACALAQSSLVASAANPERALARWTLAGAAGDLASLALVSLSALGESGLHAAFFACGAAALAQAVLLRSVPAPTAPETGPEGDPPPLLANRRLLAWALGLAFCGLLDEVVIAFGALHLEASLGAGVHARTLVLAAWMAGGLAGLAALERVASRVRPARLLALLSAGSAALLIAWIFARSVAVSAALAFAAGALASPLYPLAKARVYAALPGRPAAVNAVVSLLSPLEWAVLPIAIGLLAETFGLTAAMCALALQPLVLLLLALRE